MEGLLGSFQVSPGQEVSWGDTWGELCNFRREKFTTWILPAAGVQIPSLASPFVKFIL